MKEEFKKWKRRIETGFAVNKNAFYKEAAYMNVGGIKSKC